VIANGALILDRQGRLDTEWVWEMKTRLLPWVGWMEESLERLTHLSDGHARPRLVAGPAGLPAYLVAKAPGGWWDGAAGRTIRETFDWGGCRLALHGDELQALPPGVGKAEALAEVMHRYFGGRRPLLCFGDMPGDLGFMRLGGILATPRYSPLEETWLGSHE
jgi:hypothetical protein